MKPKVTRKRFMFLGLLAFAALIGGGLLRFLKDLVSKSPGTGSNQEKAPAAPAAPARAREEVLHEVSQEEEKTAVKNNGQLKGWKRTLGKTGVQVSLLGLGGAGILAQEGKEDEAAIVMNKALDEGVNYIDTAPTYANGRSELHIGQVMKHRRQEVFLASKTLDRSYDETLRLVEQSLERLQTDYLDLCQVHGIEDKADVDRALQREGSVRALDRLKNEGVIKFIGVTGHKDPAALRYMLEKHAFDCVLMPLNPADVYYNSFQKELLPYAVEQNLGIIAMKVAAYGRLLRPGGISSMKDALHYVCSLPVSTSIVGVSSLQELEENLRAAREFIPLEKEAMKKLEELTSSYQEEANFFKREW